MDNKLPNPSPAFLLTFKCSFSSFVVPCSRDEWEHHLLHILDKRLIITGLNSSWVLSATSLFKFWPSSCWGTSKKTLTRNPVIINHRWINPYLRQRRRRRRRKVSAHLWSIITRTLILSESAFDEEFPPCWTPLIMSHDYNKATNQSLSLWCQEKWVNTQFLLCASICCCCVLRCTFDAAINLPSHRVLLQMFTLTQGWLDSGGHDSCLRSLQPHTLSVGFWFFCWNVKCEAIGFLCWFGLSDIHPESFS